MSKQRNMIWFYHDVKTYLQNTCKMNIYVWTLKNAAWHRSRYTIPKISLIPYKTRRSIIQIPGQPQVKALVNVIPNMISIVIVFIVNFTKPKRIKKNHNFLKLTNAHQNTNTRNKFSTSELIKNHIFHKLTNKSIEAHQNTNTGNRFSTSELTKNNMISSSHYWKTIFRVTYFSEAANLKTVISTRIYIRDNQFLTQVTFGK